MRLERVVTGYRELICAAFDLVPEGIRVRLGQVPFLCGVDPIFAGLHKVENAADGRSYGECAHVVWPLHLTNRPASDRVSTVVLPRPISVAHVVHELGHVLDERIGWERPGDVHPVSAYARTDTWEAWAEAFTSWCIPGYADRPDDCTVALLDELADR